MIEEKHIEEPLQVVNNGCVNLTLSRNHFLETPYSKEEREMFFRCLIGETHRMVGGEYRYVPDFLKEFGSWERAWDDLMGQYLVAKEAREQERAKIQYEQGLTLSRSLKDLDQVGIGNRWYIPLSRYQFLGWLSDQSSYNYFDNQKIAAAFSEVFSLPIYTDYGPNNPNTRRLDPLHVLVSGDDYIDLVYNCYPLTYKHVMKYKKEIVSILHRGRPDYVDIREHEEAYRIKVAFCMFWD